MNKWFIIHDLLAFKQHPNMISSAITKTAKGTIRCKFWRFGQIKKGDLVVYYTTYDKLIVGIFRVVSDMRLIQNDPNWGDVMVFDIDPFIMPPSTEYLDFKKLLTTSHVFFDLFPKKATWGNYLQGKTCLWLSEKDYNTIEGAISQKEYLKNKELVRATTTGWHEKHGKGLEQLLVSLSDSEKQILTIAMSIEKDGKRINEEDLGILGLSVLVLDCSLRELKIRGLISRLSGKSGDYRFCVTKRGRTVATLICRSKLK